MTVPHATGKQIAKGAAWLMGFKLLDKSIGLISTLVLVRVLTPSDFGLVAMAMAVVALLELMGAFGFDSALIQRQDTARSHFDTAWTFNVIFGVCIALFLVAMAIPAAAFYREPRLELMLPVLAIGAVIGGFENIGTVAFRKELNFRMEFIYLFIKRIAAFAIVITLALTLRSFWALIFATIAGKAMTVLISYMLHPYRPRFSLAARGDLFNFSKWLFISNLIQFLHSRSTDFVLGRTVGAYGLGVYNLAAEMAAMPSTELIAPLNRAVYPAYAQLARARETLWARFLEVYGLIAIISLPVAFGLFSLSDLLVALLLGPQWGQTVPVMQILGLCGLVGALQGNLYVVMSAMGKPKANTILSGSLLIISLPLVVISSINYGLMGAAYAHFASSFFALIGIMLVFRYITQFKLLPLLHLVIRPFIAASIMMLSLYVIRLQCVEFIDSLGVVFPLLALIIFGGGIYSVVIISLWIFVRRPEGPERNILQFLARLRVFRMFGRSES